MKKIQNKVFEKKYGNDRKCIEILELIIEEFYEFIKNAAIDFIIHKSTTAHRFFGLPTCFIENSSQKISNNFNKSSIVKKLYINY